MKFTTKARQSRWKAIVAARVLLVLGLIDIVSSTSAPFHKKLSFVKKFVPEVWPNLASTGTVIIGVLLMVLSFAIARRSHAAFMLTELLLLVSVSLHLIKGLFISEAAASAIMFIFLILIRREFYAKPHRTIITRAVIVFAQIALLSFGIGLFLILAPDRLFSGEVSTHQVLNTIFRGFVGLSGPVRFVSHREQYVFDHAMPSLGFLTLIIPILTLLQPSPPKPRMTAHDEAGVRGLLTEFGDRDSVGYFALREDKSVAWSPTRKAAITYRVVGGCALASGDPIGNPDAWPLAMENFMSLCLENGWTPAVVGCSEEAGEIWVRETKMIALEIGDEAVVHVSDYEPDNPRYRNVRQTVRRILKQDYSTQIYRSSDLTAEMRKVLTEDSRKWRGGNTERGFMMGLGRIAESDEPDLLIVTAVKEGQVRAILQYVPWGEKALSLDLMRRAPQADAGVNELMIDATINYARANGIDNISLNFATFRSVFERGAQLGAGPVIRSWRSVLLFLSRWLQMESLYRFNSKFRPEWVPRYVIFRKNADLPKIGIATLRAEAFIGSRRSETRKTTSLG